jgi:hypothetical protein
MGMLSRLKRYAARPIPQRLGLVATANHMAHPQWVRHVGRTQRLAVVLSQLGSLNTQNEPPWAMGLVSSAMSPPHSGTAPP